MLNWKKLEDQQPELFDIAIISLNDDLTDHRKWQIAEYLESDDKSFRGFLVDFDENEVDISIKAENVKYWCELYEGGYKLPPDYKKEDLPKFYEVFRKLILSYEQRFLLMASVSKKAKKKVYQLDEYFDGIYNRSLSLIHAVITLLDNKNYMAAASIVRLHLDNFLRLNAAWLVDNPHVFAKESMAGKAVKNMKDRDGKKMLDFYLVEQASKTYPWIKDVYEKACGFVHFSNTHIFSNKKMIDGENGIYGTYIGKSDWDNVTDKSRIEVLAVMIEISDCILKLAYGWARKKMQEDAVEQWRKSNPD